MDTHLSAAPSAKLSIRGVAKNYGLVSAIAEASLEMAEGEFLTLLGPSGSGKSTLLMIVAGLIQPTAGDVWIGGKLSTYAPPNKRDIGVVFQNYALFPHLTIAENIAFPLRMRGVSTAEAAKKVARALEIVQLPTVAGRLPKELSGGQQQRIALARCMVYEPSIILMDEPLGALDRKLRDHMQLEIKRLHKQLGITVLYVTHDQEEAMAMSDRICLMSHGRIEQIGSPHDLYYRPKTVFAADFLGDSNILDAKILEAGEDGALEIVGGSKIRAPIAAGMSGGAAAKLVLRPENLRVLDSAGTADNIVEGELSEVVFTGGMDRYFITLPGGVILSTKQFTDAAAVPPAVGSRVRIGWRRDQAVVLAAE